jgi:alpha-galactosidase
MTPETLAILSNREVIAIDQDPLGRQGDRVSSEGPLEVWARPLSGGAKAVALMNTADFPNDMAIDFATLGFKGAVKVRDVWAGKDLGKQTRWSGQVLGHGVVLLRVG